MARQPTTVMVEARWNTRTYSGLYFGKTADTIVGNQVGGAIRWTGKAHGLIHLGGAVFGEVVLLSGDPGPRRNTYHEIIDTSDYESVFDDDEYWSERMARSDWLHRSESWRH